MNPEPEGKDEPTNDHDEPEHKDNEEDVQNQTGKRKKKGNYEFQKVIPNFRTFFFDNVLFTQCTFPFLCLSHLNNRLSNL